MRLVLVLLLMIEPVEDVEEVMIELESELKLCELDEELELDPAKATEEIETERGLRLKNRLMGHC